MCVCVCERERERERERGGGGGERGGGGGRERENRLALHVTSPLSLTFRSHSHSSDSSFEDDFGVRKEVLLHGTYDDYIKAYKSRSAMSSSSKAPPSMADVAAAYQKALSQVATALQHQGGSSSKVSQPWQWWKQSGKINDNFVQTTPRGKVRNITRISC